MPTPTPTLTASERLGTPPPPRHLIDGFRLRSAEWERLRRRPLELPRLARGAPCPITPTREVASDLDRVAGTGPFYASGLGVDGALHYGYPGYDWPADRGYARIRMSWVARAGNPERGLVRGRQLDGQNTLRFELSGADRLEGELLLPEFARYGEVLFEYGAGAAITTLSGWHMWGAAIAVRAPVCYAVQVDTADYSKSIVFRVERSAPPPTPTPRVLPADPPPAQWRIPFTVMVPPEDDDSPDGGFIPPTDLREVRADGSGERLLWESSRYAMGESDARPILPRLSPDGRRVAFVAPTSDITMGANWDLFVAPAGGGPSTRLTMDEHWQHSFAWSPDGERLVLDTADGFATISASGGAPEPVPNGRQIVAEPSWAADGRRLVFRGHGGIYVMGIDGTGRRRVTSGGGRPAWSPDGAHIAFVSESSGESEIYIVDADGTGLRRLTGHPSADGSPRWSPDSRHVAFVSRRDAEGPGAMGADVYVVSAEGGAPVRVTRRGDVLSLSR